MINGDRIRQMSNEEWAKKLDYDYSEIKCDFCKYAYIEDFDCALEEAVCEEGIKAYLESEEE